MTGWSKPIKVFFILLLLVSYTSCHISKKVQPFDPGPPTEQADTDADGVDDEEDKCPETAGLKALYGCPDQDGDGIADKDDECPAIAGMIVNKGCPIPDADMDGVDDANDKCPTEPGTTANKGCPVSKIDTLTGIILYPTDSLAYIYDPDTDKANTTSPQVEPGKNGQANDFPTATIAYGYANKMKIGDEMDIRVRIELSKPEAEVKATLKKIMNENKAVKIAATDSTITNSLIVAGDKRFLIIPDYNDSIFVLKPSLQEVKELNLKGPTNWSWRVTALRATKQSHINLKVYSVDDNGVRHERDDAVMYITVTVEATTSPLVVPSPSFLSKYRWALLTAAIFLLSGICIFLWKKSSSPAKQDHAVYFSYAWDQQEVIIDQLYESMRKDAFEVVRDKTDLRYKGRISTFMSDIGKANFIIIAISDKYLKSRFCMFELYEIYRNAKMDKDEFLKRIFPLRVENIDLNDPDVVHNYINFWEREESKWDKRMNENSDNMTPEQTKQYHIIKRIVTELTTLLPIIADINALSIDQHLKDDFAAIKSILRKELDKGA